LTTLAAYFRLARPATLPAPLTGVCGGAVAAAGGWPDAARLYAALASALLLTAGSNAWNQIADLDTDRINRPRRPLPAGAISLRAAWLFAIVTTVAALALAWKAGLGYLACVALTIPITAAYSFEPVRTKKIPYLANATIATPRGLLLVLAGWAVGGGLDRTEAWILGALSWLYIFGAATTKDFGDIEGDRATGCRTLPIVLGPARAARFVAPFLVIPFVAYPVAGAVGLFPGGVIAWAALGLPLALLGAWAAALLVKSPLPRDGRPHPAWGLMYAQLALAPIGVAVLFATL